MNPSPDLKDKARSPVDEEMVGSLYNPSVDYTKMPISTFTGARYIIEVCSKVNANVMTTGTALTYFHTFYEHARFEEYDPFTIGCTCIYLGSKVVDDDIRIRDIINVGLNCIKPDTPPLMLEQYFVMRDSLCQAELLLMRILSFKLKIDLPHKYLLHYLRALRDWLGRSCFEELPISATAWSVLQDAYHDSLVVKEVPQVVAAASLHVTLELLGVSVPGDVYPWYTVLHEECTKEKVTEVAFKVFELYGKDKELNLARPT